MQQEMPVRYEPSEFYLEDLDARAFANWLREAYEKSSFKTITALAAAVNSNKATISRLMSGSPQTLTGKPSQPRISLVQSLAKVLDADVEAGLFYAGHPVYGRPYDQKLDDPHGLYSGMNKLTPERQAIAKKQIAAILQALAEEDHDTDYIDDDDAKPEN